MKILLRSGFYVVVFLACCLRAAQGQQGQEVKFVANTLIVQAEGKYETDPEVAVLTFDVSAQEKDLKAAYGKATQAIRTVTDVAGRNGLGNDAIETGVLTVTPFYDNSRNRRTRAYLVQGHVVLRIKDFSKVGPIMDDSVQDGITDFRSLTYSLADEEAAKKKAVANAMDRAQGRATVALEQTKQKLGPALYVNIEAENMVGVLQYASEDKLVALDALGNTGRTRVADVAPPPVPPVQPGKITITATLQCVFQIER